MIEWRQDLSTLLSKSDLTMSYYANKLFRSVLCFWYVLELSTFPHQNLSHKGQVDDWKPISEVLAVKNNQRRKSKEGKWELRDSLIHASRWLKYLIVSFYKEQEEISVFYEKQHIPKYFQNDDIVSGGDHPLRLLTICPTPLCTTTIRLISVP